MPLAFGLQPVQDLVVDSERNLRLARPVLFADRGALPESGRHHGRVRIRVVEALVATLISAPGLVADFQDDADNLDARLTAVERKRPASEP